MEEKDKSILDKGGKIEEEFSLTKPKSKWSFIYYILYLIIGLVSYYLFKTNNGTEVVLGDFGVITKVVLFVFAMTSVKWLPILSIVGAVLYYNRTKVKDIVFVYMGSIFFIFIVSVFLLLT